MSWAVGYDTTGALCTDTLGMIRFVQVAASEQVRRGMRRNGEN
jgi:hypothetical protein